MIFLCIRKNVRVKRILRLLFLTRITRPACNMLTALHACIGRSIESVNILFFIALFASVALGATQEEILVRLPSMF